MINKPNRNVVNDPETKVKLKAKIDQTRIDAMIYSETTIEYYRTKISFGNSIFCVDKNSKLLIIFVLTNKIKINFYY